MPFEEFPDGIIVADADARVTGTARGLYAGLWNRGRDYAVAGDAEVLESFLDQLRVTW